MSPHALAEGMLAAALVLAGIIHLVPSIGVISSARLQALYGIPAPDPGTLLLLRHRAVLFGLLGALFLAAAAMPAWRVIAAALALVSIVSFVLLARGVAVPALRRVGRVDVVLGAVLALALGLRLALGR